MTKRRFILAILVFTIFSSTAASANAAQCIAVASKNTTAVSRDEGMMISACEYRSDCNLEKGAKLLVRAIVVLPYYDMHNMFLQGEDGACFMSRDFDFNEDCNAPVKVGEGCE
jgi:hypothetical protein